jgi:hypothetical protein
MEKVADLLEFLAFMLGITGVMFFPIYFFWWVFVR